jgi:DNA-directed RNA polymerase subunit RPC12/RpoP
MARVNWEDDNVGNRKQNLKFKANAWTRFTIIDLEAEYEKIHYDRGYCACTKQGSRKAYKCGKCGGALGVNSDIANPGVICQGCQVLNGPKVAVCQWCDYLKKTPEDRFATNVILYKTDDQGQLYGPFNEKSFEITWWPFGTDKWNVIRMAKKQYGDLRKHDFLFYCQEEKWQRGTLQACPDSWWLSDPNITKMVAKAYNELKENDLAAQIARFIPYEQQLTHINNQPQNKNQNGQQGQNGQQRNQRPQAPMGGMPVFDPSAVASRVGASAPQGMPVFSQPPPAQQDPGLDQLLAGPTVLSTPPATQQQLPIQPPPTPSQAPSTPATTEVAHTPVNGSGGGTADLDAMLAEMNR